MSEISIRIPRRLVVCETDTTITVRFPDSSELVSALLMEMSNCDESNCVTLEVGE